MKNIKSMKNIKNTLRVFGFLMLLSLLAVGMNACSKKKNSSGSATTNPNFLYGYNGAVSGGNLGVGGGYSPDGSSLELSFSGQDNGSVVATGYLTISSNAYSSGCGVAPGVYSLQTQQPGYFSSGDFENIQLIAQNGMPVMIQFGWFNNSYVNMPNGQMSRIFAVVNIPGCPTNFN